MPIKIKTVLFTLTGFIFTNYAVAQTAVSIEKVNDGNKQTNNLQIPVYTKNKKLPAGYEKETLAALTHFPDLKKVRVKFKIKKSYATLKTRPTIISMILPKGLRAYVIIISDKTIQKLEPLTFAELPEDARIGVIGHELSHVVDFHKKNCWQCFKVALGHMSKTYMDSLEFHTDQICIDHGLGKKLESWSSYIRNTMHTKYWRGADFANKVDTRFERYMNPDTIEKHIEAEKHNPGSSTIIVQKKSQVHSDLFIQFNDTIRPFTDYAKPHCIHYLPFAAG